MDKYDELSEKPMKDYRMKISGVIEVRGRTKLEALANLESVRIGDIPDYTVDWCLTFNENGEEEVC